MNSSQANANVYESFETTANVKIPKDPLDQIIGQETAVNLAKIAAVQRRHLLLVGPPGIGKSMLAQAIAFHLPKPTQEVSVLHNPENPERPTIQIRTETDKKNDKKIEKRMQGTLLEASQVPFFVAERLGFKCRKCNVLSPPEVIVCPNCSYDKFITNKNPFGDLLNPYFEDPRKFEVRTTRQLENGNEEVIIYRAENQKIRVLDQEAQKLIEEVNKKKMHRVLTPLDRKTFITATGASETELLGDVRHDPWGGRPDPRGGVTSTFAFERVVAGAVHDAHEGVLFVDELSSMGPMQRFLLTAMQEKRYSIVGKNPNSSGASVRVENVPCDFILIAASNINDVHSILPPLHSRIIGNGYEILLDTTMPDTTANRQKLVQFSAQEIKRDGKIPHANYKAVERIIQEASTRAQRVDDTPSALTLRLRELSGLLRLAGDYAVSVKQNVIDETAIEFALKRSKSIDEQLSEKYGSIYKAHLSEKTNTIHANKNVREIS